jgi:anti-sigma factor RsiW
MTCDSIRPLLEAHADGELDLVRQLEVEAHLAACPACAAAAAALAARRAALRGALPRFPAPAALRGRVLAGLRAAEPVPASAKVVRFPVWAPAALAAALAAAALLGFSWGSHQSRSAARFAEAFGDHARSLQAGHLVDVVSTDQHTVKPWFMGKLDFSPPVLDLASSGFPLAGGRLERIDGRAAAALVFHRRLHVVNLLIWPADAGPATTREEQANGFNAASWSQGGLNFLAVSEIPMADLETFAAAYRSQAR